MKDCLVVGQGLAGSLVAYLLHKQDKNVSVVAREGINSSRVAAGLYNPVTGRKMVRTWMADELFEDLEEWYMKLEQELQASFLIQRRIYRPFQSVEEQNDWEGRSADPKFRKFIRNIHRESLYPELIHDRFGGLELEQSGYLDTRVFLDAMAEYFRKNDILIQEKLEEDELVGKEGCYEWKGEQYRHVIFCEGIEARESSNFGWLPFQPLKGELVHIKTKASFEHIVNRGVFILEVKKGEFKVGSTYNWRDPFSGPSEEGKKELLERLEQIFRSDYEVLEHYAGIRPSTKDRRPFVGEHPEKKNMWIFNGLGTKGVTLGPYFAKQFINYLVNNKALDPVVNINRYYSLYYHSF